MHWILTHSCHAKLLPVLRDSVEGQALNGIVEIAERTSLRLVGLWHSGDYNEIGRVVEKVMAAAEIELWPRREPFTVGVYFEWFST